MKKWNKLISLGVLTTTVFYTCSPIVTLAVTEEPSNTIQSTELSSDASINSFSTEEIQATTSSEAESSSTEESISNSTEVENNDSEADISAFINKKIELVPISNTDIRFSESDNGSAYVDNKNNLSNQTYTLQATEDGWWTIQNSTTKNYFTLANTSLYFTTLQNTDEQKWRFVNEENGTYSIESKTHQFLEITETNSLQVSKGEVKQRWSIVLPTEEPATTESSSPESTTDTTTQTTSSTQETQPPSESVNMVEQTPIDKTKMKITIKNPNGGNVTNVQFPTWSNTNGQDDIKWLNGTKNSDGSWSVIIDVNQYKNDGQFNTHIYTKVNGKDTFLASTAYSLEYPPANIVTKAAIGNSRMKITISNPNGGNVTNVQFPTWSNTNGQDDIKWLNGTKNSDGSWSVVVEASQYKHDGQFNTHIYTKVNGKDTFLASTSYNLEFPPVNIVEINAIDNNKMKITIFNPNGGNVTKVQFPTWSNTNGQDDIKWLNGTENSDGSWSVTVDANQYKHDGQFNTHIYAKVNGKDTFLDSISYTIKFSPVTVEKTAIGKNKMKITISNPNGGNVTNVQFPTWSNTNGQDDIKWLNGTKNSNGSWSVTIDANQYKHDGQFNTHIYTKINGKDTFLNSTTYNLEFSPVTVEKTAIDKNKMKITISKPNGENITNVQFPTWSNTNGQDDIKWLNGTKNSDGSWSVIVDANQYKHDGQFNTHIYTKVNGKDTFLASTSYNLVKAQDDVAIRLSKKPYYYSQLDGRWSNTRYGISTLGPSGCVPTSMAMVLKGHFGMNVSPVDTANRIYSYGGFNQSYFGASGTDFVRGMNSYGKTVVTLNSLAQLNDYLSKGYPVVMFVNVGIGHAVVAHGYSGSGYTTVYDPYGKQFYNGTVATGTLWSTPSTDSIDWSAGRPYFAIK